MQPVLQKQQQKVSDRARCNARVNYVFCALLSSLVAACGSGSSGGEPNIGAAQAASEESTEQVYPVAIDLSDNTRFSVRAIDGDGAGPWSDPIAYSPQALSDYIPPEALNGVDQLLQASQWIEWEHDPEALGYEFRAIDALTGSILAEHTLAANEICAETACRVMPTKQPNTATESQQSLVDASIDQIINVGDAPYTVELNALVPSEHAESVRYRWSVPGLFVNNNKQPSFSHTFDTPGAYRVRLRVTDDSGLTSVVFASVVVSQPQELPDTITDETDGTQDNAPAVFTASVDNSPVVNLGLKPVLYVAKPAAPEAKPAETATTSNVVTTAYLPTPTASSEQTLPTVHVNKQPVVVPETNNKAPAVNTSVTDSEVAPTTSVAKPAVDITQTESPTIAAALPSAGPAVVQQPIDQTAPTITRVEVSQITTNTAIVSWDLTEYSTGQVEFGQTENLGSTSTKETSFRWAAHIQRLQFLEPGTDYYFRVHSTDEAGNAVVSEVRTFTTAGNKSSSSFTANNETTGNKPAPSAPPEDWPANTNPELPMAGIFYGNFAAGIGAQNSAIAIESSRRFRAERTGTLDYVRYQNRTLNMNNITSRCKDHGPGSVWCDCVDAGLDAYTCGYTLGSSYHVGNGGTIVVELRTNNNDGTPSNVVLGKTVPFVPMDNAKTPFPALEFTTPVNVQEGHIYHLVFTNLNPPTSCTALVNIAPNQAASCPRHQGAQGLDGTRMLSVPSVTGLRGPFLGDKSAANLFRRTQAHSWRVYPNALAWYEVGYTDGVAVGDSYSTLESMGVARHTIQGAKKARHLFTVQGATRRVDGMWLSFGHTNSASGSPLKVVLKDENGSTLATGNIPFSNYCRQTVIEKKVTMSHWCQDWQYTSFGQSVSLLEGSTYSVEMSANSGAGFILSAYESLQTHGFKDRNNWSESRVQLSTNNGASWGNWTPTRPDERDLSLLFTIEGMPRQLK